MRPHHAITCLVSAALFSILAGPSVLVAEEGMTFSALQVAYGRELDSRAQYLAFASRADLEGHASVACLFWAVARAESVHAARHAAAIEQLGGTPARRPVNPVVRGTAENLGTSIVLELEERHLVYRRFADYARDEYLSEALASFCYAQGAEATHEALFRVALGTLAREASPPRMIASTSPGRAGLWDPSTSSPTIFVCIGDGSVFSSPVRGACPNCGSGGSRRHAIDCRH